MRVAFATQDLHRVDAHFASARNFILFDVQEDCHTLVEAVQFDAVSDENGVHADEGEDRLGAKIAALAGVSLLFVLAIGGPAAARVVRARVHPVKLSQPEPIVQVIGRVQQMMKGTPPPWLRKLMTNAKPDFTAEED
ncbi:MAG: nitrogen fixation protein NifX [Magnetospirillum sp.]|nr:nitrogen fixation protein NifX [Magnetospirillum sp.]